VSVTTALYGSVYYYLDFPIDLIERIEVLRGPASALYGTGAYSGAINVITKLAAAKDDKNIFLYGDNYTNKSAGAVIGFENNKLKIAVDGYYQDGDKTIDSKKSIRPMDTDGQSHERLKDYSAGLKVQYDTFNWLTRLKKSDAGNFFGPEEYAVSDDDVGQTNEFIFSEISYRPKLDDNLEIELKAGYNEYEFDVMARALPEAAYEYTFEKKIKKYLIDQGMDKNTATTTAAAMAAPYKIDPITEDYIYGFNSKETSSYGAISMELPVSNHKLKAEYFHKKTQNIKNSYSLNYPEDKIEVDVLNGAASFDWAEVVTHKNGFIGDNVDRTLDAYTISDLILYDNFDIAFAFRQDDYNHFKPVTSTNIGAVYRLDATSNIKLAYGQAFRIPSWLEYYSQKEYIPDLYGNQDLKPEKIETTELFWTYMPNQEHRLRAGLFYSKMSDVIDIAVDQSDIHVSYEDPNAPENTYVNYSKRETQGFEAEYDGKLDIKNKIVLSASYLYTMAYGLQPYYNTQKKSDGKDVPIPDVSEILANAIYTHSFSKSLSLASRVYYIGEKTQNGARNRLDDFVDVTETLHYYINADWQISLSVKNLLDDKHYVPSSWSFHKDGLPREERYCSIRLAGSF